MIEYAVENAFSIEDELKPLLPEHMAEFDIYGPPLTPFANLAAYHQLASMGILSAMTARVEGELVGYWLGVISQDPHHKMTDGNPVWQLTSQAYYIAPEWRSKATVGLFNFVEEKAEENGISLLGQRVRPSERTATFFEAIGYAKAETVYVKPIGKAKGSLTPC